MHKVTISYIEKFALSGDRAIFSSLLLLLLLIVLVYPRLQLFWRRILWWWQRVPPDALDTTELFFDNACRLEPGSCAQDL